MCDYIPTSITLINCFVGITVRGLIVYRVSKPDSCQGSFLLSFKIIFLCEVLDLTKIRERGWDVVGDVRLKLNCDIGFFSPLCHYEFQFCHFNANVLFPIFRLFYFKFIYRLSW